ncbi:histidine kinase dimerization/phosphoacceptor domain-containing protein [Streptomyces sp. M19]
MTSDPDAHPRAGARTGAAPAHGSPHGSPCGPPHGALPVQAPVPVAFRVPVPVPVPRPVSLGVRPRLRARIRSARSPAVAIVVDAFLIAVALLDTCVNVGAEERLGMACAVLASCSLALRRRLPLPVYVVALPAVLVSGAMVGPLVALYTLASLARSRAARPGRARLRRLLRGALARPRFSDLSGTQGLISIGYSLATAAAPVFLGQLVQARRDLSLRLTEITEAREHERLLLAQTVLAKERAQLAREMHDVVSHQVSLIAVRAGALQVSTRDPESKEAASTIRRLSVQTLDELRHMVSVLRASGSLPTDLTRSRRWRAWANSSRAAGWRPRRTSSCRRSWRRASSARSTAPSRKR